MLLRIDVSSQLLYPIKQGDATMFISFDSVSRKPTGFRCYRDELFVGDLLSCHSGYEGFRRVVEREDGFWLIDWEYEKGDLSQIPIGERHPDVQLKSDIGAPYRKVDPDDPYREPPFPIYCDQCEETVVGYFDAEEDDDHAFTWTDDCASHRIEYHIRQNAFTQRAHKERTVCAICKACADDPQRTSQTKELHDYFRARLAECPIRSSHYPVFRTKEDIDTYFENLKKMSSVLFPEDDDPAP